MVNKFQSNDWNPPLQSISSKINKMTILIKLNHTYFGVAQVNPSMQNMANYDKYSDKPKMF